MYSSIIISGSYTSLFVARTTGAEGWAYVHDGYSKPYCADGIINAGVLAGMSTPLGMFTSVTATSGSFTSGTHFVRYRYWNSQTGYPSPAGTQTSFVATAEKQVALYGMTASSDPRCDQIVVEMTEASGVTYYRAAYISNVTRTAVGSAYILSVNDDTLAQQLTPYTNTQLHSRPYPAEIMTYHKGFMFTARPATYTTGSVSITSGSTAVTFSGVTLDSALDEHGYLLEIDKHNTSYKIASYTSGGAATLNIPATDTLAGYSYKMYPQYKNRVYVSQSLYPESFSAVRFADVLRGTSDEVTALVPHNKNLMVFGKNSLELWQWDLDPLDLQDARITGVQGNRGALSQKCVVSRDNVIYALDYNGVYVYGGGNRIKDISANVRNLFNSINWDESNKFHAHVDEINGLIVFFVCMGRDTLPRHALVFDTNSGKWCTYFYDAEVKDSESALDGYGQKRPLILMRDSHLRYGSVGYADSTIKQGFIEQDTVDTATTSSVSIDNDTKMYSDESEQDGNTYVGMPVYWEEGRESSAISAVNVSAGKVAGFNVSPSFSSAPASADTLTFGRIHVLYKTKKFNVVPDVRMRNTHLSLYFEPVSGDKYMYLRVFEDGSTAAKSNWNANTAVNGVTFQADNQYIKVNLGTSGGVVHVPMQFDWKHSVQFEFSIREPNVPLRLYKYQLSTEIEDDSHGY